MFVLVINLSVLLKKLGSLSLLFLGRTNCLEKFHPCWPFEYLGNMVNIPISHRRCLFVDPKKCANTIVTSSPLRRYYLYVEHSVRRQIDREKGPTTIYTPMVQSTLDEKKYESARDGWGVWLGLGYLSFIKWSHKYIYRKMIMGQVVLMC